MFYSSPLSVTFFTCYETLNHEIYGFVTHLDFSIQRRCGFHTEGSQQEFKPKPCNCEVRALTTTPSCSLVENHKNVNWINENITLRMTKLQLWFNWKMTEYTENCNKKDWPPQTTDPNKLRPNQWMAGSCGDYLQKPGVMRGGRVDMLPQGCGNQNNMVILFLLSAAPFHNHTCFAFSSSQLFLVS